MRAKLQQLRKSNGYTQQTFSAAVGTSRSHYAQIETGDKQPALRLALRIKRVLNYYGDDIFDNTMPVGRKCYAPKWGIKGKERRKSVAVRVKPLV